MFNNFAMPFSSLIKLTTKCTNTNTEKNLSCTGRKKKKMYVPEKDFVPHFYTQAKWGRKTHVKSNPLFLRESDHFLYPWKALAKNKQTNKKIKKRERKERILLKISLEAEY